MIFDMITQDGVLNLQAKNIQQSPGDAHGHQEMMNERVINFNSIFCKKVLSSNRFDSIVKLNLSSNKIQVIDGDFCKLQCFGWRYSFPMLGWCIIFPLVKGTCC